MFDGECNQQLIELALAHLSVDQEFAEAFREARGRVDTSVNLEI
jgi:hypothetical protein